METTTSLVKGGVERIRIWRVYLTEWFAANQEAAIRYLKFSLEEYQVGGDTPLLLALRTVVESQGGISILVKKTGIAQNSSPTFCPATKSRPLIDTLGTILNALGCRLLIEPIAGTYHCFEPKREGGTDVNSDEEKGVDQVVEAHLSWFKPIVQVNFSLLDANTIYRFLDNGSAPNIIG